MCSEVGAPMPSTRAFCDTPYAVNMCNRLATATSHAG